MPALRIERRSAPAEERPLARTEPVSVGRHSSNDVCVDEEGVGTLHCRIAWNRDAFEVVAASADGVDVNGTIVRSMPLRPGDVVRVGSVDLRLVDGEGEPPVSAGRADSAPGLKPLGDEERGARRAPPAAVAASKPLRGDATNRKEGKQVSQEDRPGRRRRREVEDVFEEIDEAEELVELDEFEHDSPSGRSSRGKRDSGRWRSGGGSRAGAAAGAVTAWKRFLVWFGHRDVRPGQEDVVRSPFSLGMVVAGLVLVLAAVTLWFVIGRDSAQIAWNAATDEMEKSRYTEAMQRYQDFIRDFPKDERAPEARAQAGRARVERELGGAAPNVTRGLEALKLFIGENRDEPNFAALAPDIRDFSNRIALEAAKQAERTRSAELMPISEEAEAIFKRYPPPEGEAQELVAKIDQAQRAAVDAIDKRDWSEERLAKIEAHLAASDPMAAFAERRTLLARYADLERDARVVELLEKTRETERDRVVRDDAQRDALTEDRPTATVKAVSLAVQTRTRTDLESEGRLAIAVAGGSCWGVDNVTGAPLWRRPIGLDSPFHPVAVQSAPPAWLLFDTRHDELLLIDQATGGLRWRQPVGGRVSGAPLVHDGMVYLPTLGDQLHKIDLASGRALSRLEFSQPVHTPPVLTADEVHLVVAGERDVFYTVSLNPLECVAVSYLAQPAAAIEAPLLKMGPLALFIENDQRRGARLRVLDTSGPLVRQIAEARLPGQVRDAPIIRGRELFVPYGDEAVAAFTVTDDENEQPLTRVGTHQLQNAQPGPMFLAAGPDGQLWMASTALRKLQLTAEELRLEPGDSTAGRFTQPLQAGRDSLFIARRPPYADAVFFSEVDRETLTGRWRVVLGGRIIGWDVPETAAVCVTESGHAYVVPEAALDSGGFIVRGTPLDLPEDLAVPLRAVAVSGGRVAVHCGGDRPRMWLVNRIGQSEMKPLDLPAALETDPAALGSGIVLPLPGRLRLVNVTGDGAVQDFSLPIGQERPPRWKHLSTLSDDALLAIDEKGLVRRIELRPSPVPSLVEARTFQPGSPIDAAPTVHDGRIAVADAGRTLHLLDAATLEQLSETRLDGPATGAAWQSDGKVLMEIAGARLQCFDAAGELKRLWSLPIESTHLAGPPAVEQGTIVAALQDGRVLAIDAVSGHVTRRIDLDQPLTDGPRRVGKFLVVPSLDGGLCRIDSILEAAP
ncbi:MAG: PQQ-binding-like beta-propeller repeat protein [Planctomycetales bacterium]